MTPTERRQKLQWDKLPLIVSMQVRLCCGMALDAWTACGTEMQGGGVRAYLCSVKTITSKVRAGTQGH
mgnify:CR=1 FL=1